MRPYIQRQLKELEQSLVVLTTTNGENRIAQPACQEADELLLDLMFSYLEISEPNHPDYSYVSEIGNKAIHWYNRLYDHQFHPTICNQIITELC